MVFFFLGAGLQSQAQVGYPQARPPGIAICEPQPSSGGVVLGRFGVFFDVCVSLDNMAPKSPYDCTPLGLWCGLRALSAPADQSRLPCGRLESIATQHGTN